LQGKEIIHYSCFPAHTNFLFVAATALLTETYSFEEKAKAQALNDFIILGTVTLSSFYSGTVQQALGWETVNMVVIPLLLLVVFANFWLRSKQRMTAFDSKP
jgi:hypothetical protein